MDTKQELLTRIAKIQDEDLLEEILAYVNYCEEPTRPMTKEELAEKLRQSHADIAAGRVISHEDLKEEMKNW